MPQTFHWPHSPLHMLSGNGTFIVTAGTYRKEHIFSGEERLEALCGGLLKYASKHGWALQAWAVFPNHYHFIASAPKDGAGNLPAFLTEYHSRSARWVNSLDKFPGRKVWHNYRETRLTFEESYYARLNYVHKNAVKHGLVDVANQYPWCSAGWFEKTAEVSFRKTVYGFKTDTVKIDDDF